MAAGGSLPIQAEPLPIGYLTWVGNGPFFVAQEKGLFAKEGVELELINMAIHEALYAGLFAGQIDIMGATVDDMLPHFDPKEPYVCVLAIDESLGAMAFLPPTTSGRLLISRARWSGVRSARCPSSS